MSLLIAPLMLVLRDIVLSKDKALRESLIGYGNVMDAGNEVAVGVL